MYKVIWILIGVVLFSGCGAQRQYRMWQRQEQALEQVRGMDAVDSMATLQSLSFTRDNGWGSVPPSYQYYQAMKRDLDVWVLDSLARHHEAPSVRATAGRILFELKSPLAMQMILDRVADDGEMSVFWWDMGSRLSVVDYWITCAHESGLLSLEDSLRIDSLVLHTEGLGHVDYRTHLIDVMPALPEYYPIVREAYVRDHNARVLPKLASYQKEEDIELMLAAISTFRNPKRSEEWEMALKGIGSWPDERFRDSILAVREFLAQPDQGYYMGATRYLFSALMAYRDDWALREIEECFALIKKHNKNEPEDYYDGVGMWSHWWGECFDRAYQLNPDPFFLELHRKYAYPNDMGW